MAPSTTRRLFAWETLEDGPTIRTIRKLLEVIPDEGLLASLTKGRGRGRNDVPVQVAWRILALTAALRYQSIEHCLQELRRNESLRKVVGIESEEAVPRKWNLSRFLERLGQEPYLGELVAVFDEMVQRLAEAVDDLGEQVAGDSTWIHARRRASRRQAALEEAQGLPAPAGGRKEYVDEAGRVVRVMQWFGFKLHLLVDVQHEVSVAYRITSTKRSDAELLPELVEQAEENLGGKRIRSLLYDKAADTNEVHGFLSRRGIKAVVQQRSLWREEQERVLPGLQGRQNIVYDEAGTVYCYDTVSEPVVRHRMAYIGYEPSRGTLKYRCPAMHEGWSCPMAQRCNAGKKYGLTVRVKRELDLRRFPALPRATKKFERLYRGRTAVERVIGRLKVFWGADDGHFAGTRRMFAWLGVVMVVHVAFATLLAMTPRCGGTAQEHAAGGECRGVVRPCEGEMTTKTPP